MATGGGKPGIGFKASVMARPHDKQLVLVPTSTDPEFMERLWKYFALEGTNEFFVQFSDLAPDNDHGRDDK